MSLTEGVAYSNSLSGHSSYDMIISLIMSFSAVSIRVLSLRSIWSEDSFLSLLLISVDSASVASSLLSAFTALRVSSATY